MLATNSYEWVLEGDITACFDEISHSALLARVRDRIADKRVVALVKAFLKSGVLSEDGVTRDTKAGTPQGGILSPLLANIALSVLDEQFARDWQTSMATRVDRSRLRRHGQPTYRLVRYADDFVVMVAGTKAHAEHLKTRTAEYWRARACACRRRRPASSISMKDSIFLGSASSGNANGDRRSDTSTPGRRRSL